MSKATEAQIQRFCTGCKVRGGCNEQSILCSYRLHTKPNWQQKRKAARDAAREARRANDPHEARKDRERRRIANYRIRQLTAQA